MSQQRHVIMQVVKRSGGATHHVEFCMDDNFAERLRQLLGKSQTVCAPSCKALDELVESGGA